MMYSVASDNSSHVTSTLQCDNTVALTLVGAGKPTYIKMVKSLILHALYILPQLMYCKEAM